MNKARLTSKRTKEVFPFFNVIIFSVSSLIQGSNTSKNEYDRVFGYCILECLCLLSALKKSSHLSKNCDLLGLSASLTLLTLSQS